MEILVSVSELGESIEMLLRISHGSVLSTFGLSTCAYRSTAKAPYGDTTIPTCDRAAILLLGSSTCTSSLTH